MNRDYIVCWTTCLQKLAVRVTLRYGDRFRRDWIALPRSENCMGGYPYIRAAAKIE